MELAPFRIAAGAAPAMMTAHIVYPTLDADNPATMSRRILTGMLREEWQYQGIIITDGMDMHAIAGRYGVGNAAVRADGRCRHGDGTGYHGNAGRNPERHRRCHRFRRNNASRHPAPSGPPRRAGAGLSMQAALLQGRRQRPPHHGRRLAAQPDRLWRPTAPGRWRARASDRTAGCSQRRRLGSRCAGRRGSRPLRTLYDVELVTYDNADSFDWNSLPDDGRYTMLASTSRLRYGDNARNNWKPDLHLALWNPYQALDIQAPALLTYGFAQPALEAINLWLSGTLEANGRVPVAGFE
jgi:beta-N-acetylhexosaminidase